MKTIVKVPEARVPVIMGKGKETLKEIQKVTGTKITKEENDISIDGDALDVWTAKSVIKAIARGFNPEKAMVLTDEGISLDVIELRDYCKDSQMERVKGRVIGKDGKSRKVIEDSTGAYISVYGKTISIIANNDTIGICKKAILMLLEGSNHTSVYKFLEREKSRHIKDIL